MHFWLAWLAMLALCACDRPAVADIGLRGAVAVIDNAQANDPPVMVQGEVLNVKPVSKDAPDGYVRMRPIARSGSFGNAVLLVDIDNAVVVPIYIGGTEAMSIQLRLQGRKFTRPLTHDLFDAFAAKMDAKMLRAQVDSLDENIYIGTIIFDKDGELITFDARPSDAIALAIGNTVPIFVSDALIEQAGIQTDKLDEHHADPPPDPVAL